MYGELDDVAAFMWDMESRHNMSSGKQAHVLDNEALFQKRVLISQKARAREEGRERSERR